MGAPATGRRPRADIDGIYEPRDWWYEKPDCGEDPLREHALSESAIQSRPSRASIPMAGASADAELACDRARAVLGDWRGRGSIVVFGAGAHTHKILPALLDMADRIAGIADDSPAVHGRSIGRWRVRDPADLIDGSVGGILVSSDVQQATLEARLRPSYGDRCAILTLYRSPDDDGPALPNTGERQIGRTLEEIELGHRARYYWALQHLSEGALVLDAACGNGYGSHILAGGGARVVGMDVCADAIAFAGHYYAGPRISYRIGPVDDGQSLSRAAAEHGPFDAVVSMETMEHLERPEAFIANVRTVLQPGGSFFFSTPNARRMVLENAPFHRRHFESGEVLGLLRKAEFEQVTWYGQEGMQILPGRNTQQQRYCLYRAVKTDESG